MDHKFLIFYSLKISDSKIQGKGVYSTSYIPKRKKIGSMSGAIVSRKEARRRGKLAGNRPIAIVELWNGMAIDASIDSNELRYVNHSCSPNTFMRVSGFHVEFYALRDIAANEELTCNYGQTHHDGKLRCNCGSSNCIGFI